MSNSSKESAAVVMKRKDGDEYPIVSTIAEATGIFLWKNDSSAREWKAIQAKMDVRLKGHFHRHQEEDDFILYLKNTRRSVDDFMELLEEGAF